MSLHIIRDLTSKFPQFLWRWIDVLWLIALVVYVLAGVAITPFHGDEPTLIYMSRDYAYQFIERNLDKIRYSDNPVSLTEQALRMQNGTIGKYLMGLAWHLDGLTINDLNEQWDWGADWNYNFSTGHAPNEKLLLAARWASAIPTALGAVIMFGIGWAVGKRPVAYLASLYYTLNPAVLVDGRRAMMEGSLFAFGLLAVLAGIVFLWVWMRSRNHETRRARLRYGLVTLGFGVASGLALASKHTALMTLAPLFGGCAVYPVIVWALQWYRGKRNPEPTGEPIGSPLPDGDHPPSGNEPIQRGYLLAFWGALVGAGVIALLTFYVLNPAWWGNDPFKMINYVWTLREQTMQVQMAAWGTYADSTDKFAGFLRQSLIAQPQYFEVKAWANYPELAAQIATYEASPWHGVSVGGTVVGAVILAGMIGAGVWALIWDRRLNGMAGWLIGLWAVTTALGTWLLTPFEWQRYYLPIYPPVGLLAAAGVVWLIGKVYRRVAGRPRTAA